MCWIHKRVFDSDFKRKEILKHATKWRNLKTWDKTNGAEARFSQDYTHKLWKADSNLDIP